jgi:hypothetical protein
MPGVVISTAVRTGPSATTVRESSQLFVVGLAERGPDAAAVMVESIADFEATFGGYQSYSYLHPTVETFFEEGGTQCYVARTVGAAATEGTLALLGTGAQSASTVLTLDANGAGAWSADVEVTVTHPSVDTFKVSLSYNGDVIYTTGTVTTVAQAAGRINLSSVASRYVTATANAAATTRPATVAGSALSAGADDRASVTQSDYADSLDLFLDSYGSGAVACPEAHTLAMSEDLVAHANANNRIAILHVAEAATTADAETRALDVQGGDHAEHAALYYPWIEVPTTTNGVTRYIPPDGYVAAKRAVAHNQTGSHVPDEAYVNVIRLIQNSVRVYGARSLSSDEDNFRFITQQDTVNHVVVEAQRSLEDLVFSTIDGRNTIFSAVESRLIAILSPLRDIGALFEAYDVNGRKLDSGFTVRCDAKLNPTAQLAGGTVKAKVGLRVSGVGDKIEVDIIKSNLTASVV